MRLVCTGDVGKPELSRDANTLVALSVAPSTRKTYQPGIKAYLKSASAVGFNPAQPNNEEIVRFVTSLSELVPAGNTFKGILGCDKVSPAIARHVRRGTALTTPPCRIERHRANAI